MSPEHPSREKPVRPVAAHHRHRRSARLRLHRRLGSLQLERRLPDRRPGVERVDRRSGLRLLRADDTDRARLRRSRGHGARTRPPRPDGGAGGRSRRPGHRPRAVARLGTPRVRRSSASAPPPSSRWRSPPRPSTTGSAAASPSPESTSSTTSASCWAHPSSAWSPRCRRCAGRSPCSSRSCWRWSPLLPPSAWSPTPEGEASRCGPVTSSAVACPSGQRSTPRKRVWGQPHRGFKSHRHRQGVLTKLRAEVTKPPVGAPPALMQGVSPSSGVPRTGSSPSPRA